jgi:hypothetical protein
MRLHQRRHIDPSNVRWLGKNDYVDVWQRPQKAKWMSQELYEAIPKQMKIRILDFDAKDETKSESLQVVTTLLDHKTYPACEIGTLYGYRWFAELDIFSIKTSLNLDFVRCKSPDMVLLEVWITLLAYNMVRLVCAQAARVYDKLPRQMSFSIASNVLLSQWLMPPDASIRTALGKHNLLQIASNEVGNRPGRIEPRVVKRRPKPYKLMTKPRDQYK